MQKWVALLLAGIALAGCADSGGTPQEEDTTGLDDELVATDDTGIIRGIVVDAAIVPVEGVRITIDAAGLETTTNAAGEFGFQGLEPGTYFLDAERLGYLPVQQSTDVQAGVEKPPLVRILMERDKTFNPYSTTQYYKGFYECGSSVVVLCGAPNILTGSQVTSDTSTPTIFFDGPPTFVQTEMVWESSQALSRALYFEMEALTGCDAPPGETLLANAEGESPIRARANETVLEVGTIGVGDCGIYHSVFSGDASDGAACVPGVLCAGVGVSLQQDFEWFITGFYGYEPPEDWWFIEDGALPPPS